MSNVVSCVQQQKRQKKYEQARTARTQKGMRHVLFFFTGLLIILSRHKVFKHLVKVLELSKGFVERKTAATTTMERRARPACVVKGFASLWIVQYVVRFRDFDKLIGALLLRRFGARPIWMVLLYSKLHSRQRVGGGKNKNTSGVKAQIDAQRALHDTCTSTAHRTRARSECSADRTAL